MINREFVSLVEKEYPYPIAAAFRRVRTIDNDDVVNKHDSYGDLFEIVVKYLAVVALQDFKFSASLPEYIDSFLKKMLHPSLGHWNEIIRTISTEDTSKCNSAAKVSFFYKAKIKPELKKTCDSLVTLLEGRITVRTHKDVIDLLILYRNKVKGHGAKKSKDEYKERMALLEEVIVGLLTEVAFLCEYKLIFIDEISVFEREGKLFHRHKSKECTGTLIEPYSFDLENALMPKHLTLQMQRSNGECYLDIYPLLTLYSCKDCRSEQVFVFNDLGRGRLEYLSYSCGHFYYPDMLSSDFEKFFKISVSSLDIQEISDKVGDEQYNELSYAYFSSALVKISTKEYFEALELLQLSISYCSTWESNYYYALIGMLVAIPPAEVYFYLKTCINIDPERLESNELFESFIKVFPKDSDLKNPKESNLNELQKLANGIIEEEIFIPKVEPVYTFLLPKSVRRYALAIWLILPILLLLVRGLVEGIFEVESTFIVQFLKTTIVVSFITICFYISKSMPDLYLVLLQQISEKSKDHYKKWFSEQVYRIFGHFIDSDSVIKSLNLKNKVNKNYFLSYFVLFMASLSGSVYLTCYDNLFSINALFVTFDYAVVWGTVVLGVPIIARFYSMLKNFSAFPLKPLVGSVSLLSVQRIGRIILAVSLPWTYDFFTFTAIGYLTFSTNTVISQLLLFYFMVCLGCIWTILTPLYFFKALRKSKERIHAKYSEHLEKSFRVLLENPTKENLERYHWIGAQQKEFINLKSSPLSMTSKLGLLFINTFIIGLALVYPFLKFRISATQVLTWLQVTFHF